MTPAPMGQWQQRCVYPAPPAANGGNGASRCKRPCVARRRCPWRRRRPLAETLDLAATAAEYGNPNLVSDAGVAAALAEAALQSAALNVRINLAFMRDRDFVATTDAALAELLSGAGAARDAVLTQVREAIGGS